MRRFPLTALVLLALAGPAPGQDADFTPQTADVVVVVQNGTTGEPGRAELVEVRGYGVTGKVIGTAHDVDGRAVFPGVEVVNFKPYLVEAVSGGVTYRAQERGQVFIDGGEVTVYVFDQTEDLAGLRSPGMNVVARREEAGLRLEYVVQLINETRPQRTVAADALPLQVALPAGMQNLEAELNDGPRPVEVPVRAAAGSLVGVAAALTPGSCSIVVRGLLPATDRVDLELGVNVPVEAWSLLVFPPEVDVRAPELDELAGEGSQSFARYRGEPLAPGDRVAVTLGAGTRTVPPVDVFAGDEPAAADRQGGEAAADAAGGGFPWLLAVLVAVGALAILAWLRSR